MRITDSRYDRDRLRLAVAYRLIRHEARTHTIRECTELSADRIRKLFRDYIRTQPELAVRRRRVVRPRWCSVSIRWIQRHCSVRRLSSS